MAIVKMKRLRLIGMAEDREELLRRLQRLGCVEVSEPGDPEKDQDWALLARPDGAALAELKTRAAELSGALSNLDRYEKPKGALLQPRPQISEGELFDSALRQEAQTAADAIGAAEKRLAAAASEQGRLRGQRQTLEPWLALDVPLDTADTEEVAFTFGSVSSRADMEKIQEEVAALTDLCQLLWAGRDGEQQYLLIVCHRSAADAVLEALKVHGFVRANLRGWSGTAQENARAIDRRLEELSAEVAQAEAVIRSQAGHREALRRSIDRLNQDIRREEAGEKLRTSQTAFFVEGWVPAADLDRLAGVLGDYTCAWEAVDPAEEDYPQVPVKLKNGPLTRCLNMVTDMYALPVYGTVDPNPLMAPFFILFYGIMMADMGYGLLMIGGAIFALRRLRPRESMRNFMELLLYCGISTFVIGALTGGFFGDFLPQLVGIIDPDTTFTALPALFTPLEDTMAILVGSLVLGFIQILTGQIVSFVKKGLDGHIWDGIWDEGPWWVIYLGVGLLVLGVGNVAGWPVVLILGILMLAYGSTRNAKGFGKVGAFIGAVYNGVTGIFGDVLSYARLMALMLSGSIIASVFNTLGAITGNVVSFVIIAMLGNALNFALNLLGCYVHDLRLQCLEFFKTFYQDGGRPFRPLGYDTKYVDIKEDTKSC